MKKQSYKCRYCGVSYPTAYGARLCFDLDMDELPRPEDEQPALKNAEKTPVKNPLKPILYE